MHNHDYDLIGELAEGSLNADAAIAASRQISACGHCSEELALASRALSALATLGPARLTDLERTRLHHLVNQAIEPPLRRVGSWFPALAAAAALVAVVGVSSQLLGGGDFVAEDGSSDFVASEAKVAEADASGTVMEAPAAGSAPAALAPADDLVTMGRDMGNLTMDEFRRQLAEGSAGAFPYGESPLTCLEAASEVQSRLTQPSEIVDMARAATDEGLIEGYVINDGDAVLHVAAFTAETCTEVVAGSTPSP